MNLIDAINYYYHDLADPRIKNWFLLKSIWIPILTVFFYLLAVFDLAPRFMKNRPAYELKTFIRFYNIFQIVANVYIVRELLEAYPDGFAFKCAPIVYSNDPVAIRALNACYWAILLKIIDLIETVIFILRKKNSQVTILHLYHHITTVLLALIFARYLGAGMALFFPILNCSVHVVMYTYYFLSNWEGPIKQLILPFKRYITIMQMAQFVIMIFQLMIGLQNSCPVPKIPAYSMTFNILFNFALFYNFYRKAYSNSKKKRA